MTRRILFGGINVKFSDSLRNSWQRHFYNIFKVAIANGVKRCVIGISALLKTSSNLPLRVMKCNIHAYIIYYVEPLAICQENLLLLLSDVEVHQEEESAPIQAELLRTNTARGSRRNNSSPSTRRSRQPAPVVVVEAVAQPYLQGRERQ